MKLFYRIKKYFGLKIYWILLLLVIFSLSGHIAGAVSDNLTQTPGVITFLVGESSIVKSPWPTIRVAVTDPAIANVQVLTQDEVLLQGNKVGNTDLIMWSEDEKQVRRWKVQVRLDTESLQKKLEELFPDAKLKVTQSGDSVILSGLLRKADQAASLHDFFDKSKLIYVDMTSVAGVQQVQLQVRVAEVSRTALRSLSVNTLYADNNFFGGLFPSSGTSLTTGVEFQPGSFDASFTPAVTVLAGIPRAHLETFIAAIAENQYLRILANPTLVALSGEEASFLAGGEFPIPVAQSGSGGGGSTISIEYREYGVRIAFRPVVLGDGTIRLRVAPEVSDLSSAGAVEMGGFSVPALIVRKAATTLELKNGQTFAMAGLIKNKNEAINSRIPGLGDLPVLGPLFRSVRYQKDETELVVLVTANLVEPMSQAEPGPVPGFMHNEPDDWEFYIDGKLEGKEPAKIDPQSAESLRKIGLDKLKGPGAWESYNQATPTSQAGRKVKSENEKENNKIMKNYREQRELEENGSTNTNVIWDPNMVEHLRKTPW